MTKSAAASLLLLAWLCPSLAWQTLSNPKGWVPSKNALERTNPPAASWYSRPTTTARTRLHQLHLFDKLFEEEGILGKGVTVGKVQVALTSPDRGPNSIFGILEREANDDKSLSELTHAICLALLRKSDEWVGAAGTSSWFSQNDAGKAESRFNDLANAEAAKFEKVG